MDTNRKTWGKSMALWFSKLATNDMRSPLCGFSSHGEVMTLAVERDLKPSLDLCGFDCR